MDGQISGTNETQESTAPVDPWEAAFAALDKTNEENTEESTTPDGSDNAGQDNDAQGNNGGVSVSDNSEGTDSTSDEGNVGGLDYASGGNDSESGNAFSGMLGVTEESIQKYEQELNEDVRNRAINEIAQEFIKRGIRNTNGKLGATLDDADICKRDEDGVPHFYNPETGREFTGDNPRREAKQWVDDYNEELARVFNTACEQYEQHLKQESEPQLAVMKFAPKYEKLDDIRRGMFENVIEDYEIKDNDGKVVGYSCDLDKALALVDRQIAMIQSYAKKNAPTDKQAKQSSGPVLDMKTSSGAIPSGDMAAPTSLAEAMERLQDAELAKVKK